MCFTFNFGKNQKTGGIMMKVEKVKMVCLNAVSRGIESKANKEAIQWPPVCMGLIHQPARPKSMRKESQNN